MRTLLALLFLLGAALPAAAQRRDTTWTKTAPALLVADTVAPRPPFTVRIAERTLAGTLGMVIGGVGMGAAAYQLTHHRDIGEDPGADGLLAGAVLGGAFGAAVGAAIPNQGSRCTFGDRLARGLAGAAATSAAFVLVVSRDAAEVLVAFPVVLPVSAALISDC